MFLNTPEKRIKISQTLKNFIISEREKSGVPATVLSINLGFSNSWASQIENGRTQTIKHKDLVAMFAQILNCDNENADKYLTENIKELNSDKEINFKQSEKSNHKISIFSIDEEPDKEEKLKKEYEGLIEHMNEGLNLLFDKNSDKQGVIDVLERLIVNMYCDMGFTMSVASLPLCRMERVDDKTKYKVFREIAEIIKKNGQDCSANEDIKKTTEK